MFRWPRWTLDGREDQERRSWPRVSLDGSKRPSWPRVSLDGREGPSWLRVSLDGRKRPSWPRVSLDGRKSPSWLRVSLDGREGPSWLRVSLDGRDGREGTRRHTVLHISPKRSCMTREEPSEREGRGCSRVSHDSRWTLMAARVSHDSRGSLMAASDLREIKRGPSWPHGKERDPCITSHDSRWPHGIKRDHCSPLSPKRSCIARWGVREQERPS